MRCCVYTCLHYLALELEVWSLNPISGMKVLQDRTKQEETISTLVNHAQRITIVRPVLDVVELPQIQLGRANKRTTGSGTMVFDIDQIGAEVHSIHSRNTYNVMPDTGLDFEAAETHQRMAHSGKQKILVNRRQTHLVRVCVCACACVCSVRRGARVHTLAHTQGEA